MSDIVSALGASRATTYRVHGSKAILLGRALDEYASAVTATFAERLTRGDGLDAIRSFARLRRQLRLDKTRPAGCLIMRLAAEFEGDAGDTRDLAPLRQRIEDAVNDLCGAVRDALTDADRLGHIEPGRDLDAAAGAVMAIITGLVMSRGPVLTEDELDRLILTACGAKAQTAA